jgi:hypothetical protein
MRCPDFHKEIELRLKVGRILGGEKNRQDAKVAKLRICRSSRTSSYGICAVVGRFRQSRTTDPVSLALLASWFPWRSWRLLEGETSRADLTPAATIATLTSALGWWSWHEAQGPPGRRFRQSATSRLSASAVGVSESRELLGRAAGWRDRRSASEGTCARTWKSGHQTPSRDSLVQDFSR